MDLCKYLPKDSWFREWMALWPTIESPDTYQLFSGMAAFGSILGRSCWFDNDVYRVYPMMNLLLIGPSGIGKSTAIGLAKELLKHAPGRQKPQVISSGTKERIHDDLAVGPKAVLIASELANFFNKSKYNEGTIPYVTQLLDYEDSIELRTKSGGIIVVNSPSVTILGGSTVEWLQDQLPDSAGSGGFLARFLIVAEEYKKQRVPLPGLHLEPKARVELEKRRTAAYAAFEYLLGSTPEGVIPLKDYEAVDIFSYWYMNQRAEIGHLAPFVERSREVVLRLAMLIAISCGRASIDRVDIQGAIDLYSIATSRLKSVIVPMSPDGKMLAAVLKALGREELTIKQLYSAMSSIATDKTIDRLIDSHLRSGALEFTSDNKIRRKRG